MKPLNYAENKKSSELIGGKMKKVSVLIETVGRGNFISI